MKNLSELRKQATKSAEFRGHTIKWHSPYHSERQSLQNGECINCACEIQILMNPAPNQIDIGGMAVALTCIKRKDK